MGGTVMDRARGRRRSEMGAMGGAKDLRKQTRERQGDGMEGDGADTGQGGSKGGRKEERERKIEWANSR